MSKVKRIVFCVFVLILLPTSSSAWLLIGIAPEHWTSESGDNSGRVFNSVNPLIIDILFPNRVIDIIELSSVPVALSNAGSIEFVTLGGTHHAVWLYADGTFDIVNVGTIDISGQGAMGDFLYALGGDPLAPPDVDLNLYNTGFIEAHVTSGHGTSIAVHGDTGSIQNENTIRATAAGGDVSSYGVLLTEGGDIVNNGLIESSIDGENGLLLRATATGNMINPMNLTNTGTIRATANIAAGGDKWSAVAAYSTDTGHTIVNSGIIEAFGFGPDVGARGIAASGYIENSGTISAAADDGFAWGIRSTGAVDIVNSGSITANSGGGYEADGIYSNGDAIIVNTGLIQGSTYAIRMDGGGRLDLENTGELRGDIVLSTANDIVRLRSGSSVHGSINAGAGNDDLLMQGKVTVIGDIMGFDAFTGEDELDFTLQGAMDLGGGQGAVTSGRFTLMPGCTITADTFHVMADGELMGSGSVCSDVDNQGTISPGSSPGTLTIMGNYIHAPTATYVAEIAPFGLGDLIDVSGTATIQGGTLQVVATPGYYSSFYPSTVLQADGGVTGQFDLFTATSISPYLSFSPRYTGDSVQVVSMRTATYGDYAVPGVASTMAGVFSAFTDFASWDMQSVIRNLDFSSPAEASLFFMQMSPEPYNALVDVTFGDIERFQDKLSDRLDDVRSAARAIRAAGASARAADGYDPATPTAERRWSIYAEATGDSGSMRSTSDRTDYSHHGSGFRAGADWLVTDEIALGAALGYFESQIDYGDNLGRDASVNTLSAALYGMWNTDVSTNLDYFIDGSAGWAHHWKRMRRAATIGDVRRILAAGWEEDSFFAALRTGVDFHYEGLELTPYASLAYAHQHRPEITEDGGGALSQVVEAKNYDSLATTVSAEMAYAIALNESVTLTPRIEAAWRHEFLDSDRDMTARFVLDGGPFTVSGDHPARDEALLGAGLELSFNKRVSVFADYQGSFSGDGSEHAVWGGLQVRF